MTDDSFDCGFEDPDTYRYSRSPDEELSTAVILSVADVLDCEIEELPPLTSIIDVDALNSLFVSDQPILRIEFEYGGCLVSIRRGTEILVSQSASYR